MSIYRTGMDLHNVTGFEIESSEEREDDAGRKYYVTHIRIDQEGSNRTDITLFSKEIIS